MDDSVKPCVPKARCRRYRSCATCAKIRQARFADRAEAAAAQMTIPTYYVFVPDDKTPAGIEYARRFFVRQARPSAGVWSVESGQFQPGFHLNVIAEWCEIEGRFKGHIYREPIRTHVRAVAAYMTKAERAAKPEEGFARQTGNFGTAADWLKRAHWDAPIVAGAAHQHDIAPHHVPPSAPGPETPYMTARRWLSELFAESKRLKEEPERNRAKKTND